jgi:hypothetical protein
VLDVALSRLALVEIAAVIRPHVAVIEKSTEHAQGAQDPTILVQECIVRIVLANAAIHGRTQEGAVDSRLAVAR